MTLSSHSLGKCWVIEGIVLVGGYFSGTTRIAKFLEWIRICSISLNLGCHLTVEPSSREPLPASHKTLSMEPSLAGLAASREEPLGA